MILLAIILLLFTLLVVRKNPSKWKRVVFRLLAFICILFCVGEIFINVADAFVDNLLTADLPTSYIWNIDEETSKILKDASGLQISVDSEADAAQGETEATTQSEAEAASQSSLEAAKQSATAEDVFALIIVFVSIALFRKYYHASSYYEQKRDTQKARKEHKGNMWRIPLFILGILIGLALGAYDIGLVEYGKSLGIHRAVYYAVTAILFIIFFRLLWNHFEVGVRQLLRTRLLDGIMILVTCVTLMLSVCNLANQYSIGQKVSEMQAQEFARRANIEHAIKDQLKYPDNATIKWDSNGRGGTVTAPNDFGMQVTMRFSAPSGK